MNTLILGRVPQRDLHRKTSIEKPENFIFPKKWNKEKQWQLAICLTLLTSLMHYDELI